MGKLEDLRVERVDGVDRPATGHRWVITKRETPEEIEKDYAALSKAALEALLKEEELTLSEATVETLKALAEALELEVEFKSADPAPEAAPEAPAPEAATEDVEKEDEAILEAADDERIEAAVERVLAKAIDTDSFPHVAPLKKARSLQPKEQDIGKGEREVQKGEGLYSDIIFGQEPKTV